MTRVGQRLWHRGYLGKTAERLLKVVHVSFAGVWLGAITSLLVLLAAAGHRPELGLAAYVIHDVLVFVAFSGTLVTGLSFSLVTRFGFFVHDWISVKWALALGLFVITLGWQSAALSGFAALADAGLDAMHGLRREDFRLESLRLAATQLAIVVAVYFISTLRPWGKRQPPSVDRRVLGAVVAVAALAGGALGAINHAHLERLRGVQVADVDVGALADGVYRGLARCDFDYRVEATIRSGRLVRLVAVANRDNHYARIAEAVLARIVTAQTPRVDAITGATTTSACLMRASADALTASR